MLAYILHFPMRIILRRNSSFHLTVFPEITCCLCGQVNLYELLFGLSVDLFASRRVHSNIRMWCHLYWIIFVFIEVLIFPHHRAISASGREQVNILTIPLLDRKKILLTRDIVTKIKNKIAFLFPLPIIVSVLYFLIFSTHEKAGLYQSSCS